MNLIDQRTFEIAPAWREPLARAGLDSFAALMATKRGRCLSHHTRGQTYRIALPNGSVVFVKRDRYTKTKQILVDLVRLRRAEPLSAKERRAMGLLNAAGIRTAETIAWGQHRRFGLPAQAVMVNTELRGQSLADLASRVSSGKDVTEAFAAAGRTIAAMFRADLSWPDLLPRHVMVLEDGEVALLDVERLTPVPQAMARSMPSQIRRLCRHLRPHGATETEVRALLAAFTSEELPDPASVMRA